MAEIIFDDLERTGPGTLAGRYMRSFWQPVGRAKDLAPGRAVPVRIMSEDFTLYRGESGTPHLVAFRCAHRGTQLSVGWVEDDCIRCRYHGWRYDASGLCVEQPGEDSDPTRVRIRAYPTEEYLGLIFAYLGEGEAPPIRRFPDFERPGVLETGALEVWPCNYFNRIDNDPGHVPFTHRESTRRTSGRIQADFAARTVTAEETDYGVMSTTHAPGRPEFFIHFHMPNINQTRSVVRVEGSIEDARKLFADRLFWRVPIDDDSCISYVVDMIHLTGAEADAYRERRRQAESAGGPSPNELSEAIMAGKMRIEDIGDDISMYKLFWVEDYVTQVSQGRKADRLPDRLGKIDQTVTLKRKVWERELRALAEGRPLKEWREPVGLADMSAVTV
jgi:5,5'-dehydrodivanillate O-demethylase oxygenase subunit